MCNTHDIYIVHANAFRMCRHSVPFCWIRQNTGACVHPQDTSHLVLSKTSCISCCVASSLAWGHCDADTHCWFKMTRSCFHSGGDWILLRLKAVSPALTGLLVVSNAMCTHILCAVSSKRRFLEGLQRILSSRWKLCAKKEIYLKMPGSVSITQNLGGCLIQDKSDIFNV